MKLLYFLNVYLSIIIGRLGKKLRPRKEVEFSERDKGGGVLSVRSHSIDGHLKFGSVAELADALDLGSSGQP